MAKHKGKVRELLVETYGGKKKDWERVFDMTDLGRRVRIFNNEALGLKAMAIQPEGGYPALRKLEDLSPKP